MLRKPAQLESGNSYASTAQHSMLHCTGPDKTGKICSTAAQPGTARCTGQPQLRLANPVTAQDSSSQPSPAQQSFQQTRSLKQNIYRKCANSMHYNHHKPALHAAGPPVILLWGWGLGMQGGDEVHLLQAFISSFLAETL